MSIPCLSTVQMIEVDRAMIEDYHIELIQMMENAGRNLAALARSRFFAGDARGKRITLLAGAGGNGGGGLTAARRLHNWGAALTVFLAQPAAAYRGVPAQQLDILQRMGLTILAPGACLPSACDLILDALIGYSLSGSPRGAAADLIRWANAQPAPIFSLDTPSGLDTSSGMAYEPTIRAAATLTLALPKVGLLTPEAKKHVGELYLADISVPPELYAKMGIDAPLLFAESDILRVA